MISFVGAGIVIGAEKAWVECQDLFADSPYKRAGLVCPLLFTSRYRLIRSTFSLLVIRTVNVTTRVSMIEVERPWRISPSLELLTNQLSSESSPASPYSGLLELKEQLQLGPSDQRRVT